MSKVKNKATGGSLREVLFNEIEELQKRKGNPQRAQAVASLAKQIVSTVKVELDFAKLTLAKLGDAQQGIQHLTGKKLNVSGAEETVTARSSDTHRAGRA